MNTICLFTENQDTEINGFYDVAAQLYNLHYSPDDVQPVSEWN